jgi:BBSome-interacting protein 1
MANIAGRVPKPLPADQQVKEILPKAGLVYSEKATLSEVFCKPKILPIKSATLMKLESLE